MKQAQIFLLVLVLWYPLRAQDPDFLPHFEGFQLIEKANVTKGGLFFSQMKPFGRKQAMDYLTRHAVSSSEYALVFNESSEYLGDTTNFVVDKRWMKKIYQNNLDLLNVRNQDFLLTLNPVWQLQFGNDPQVDNRLFVNSRGLDLRGVIDGKVAFHTRLIENQIEFPSYVKAVADTTGVVPFEGFWKEYNGTTTDFFRAFGSIDFPVTKHISAQVGFGRHFIGNGFRSLILSDFANSYPYLKINTEIWRISYTNLFAELSADVFTWQGGTLGASRYPKKFMASHFLDIAITDNFHLGLFETVIFGQPDSIAPNRFQLEYLNPIIFYRAVEQQDGSSGNALVGATMQWNLKKRAMIYGQFLLDELIVSELSGGNDWWGNKYGIQLGGQLYDWPVNKLDTRVEYNMSRPYTYAHQDFYTSYTHYRQPLAHPMGANFTEYLSEINYRPNQNWSFALHGLLATYGIDEDAFSSGKDPQRSYNDRPADYGIGQHQGNEVNLRMIQARATYHWKYHLSLDITTIIRREAFENNQPDRNSTIFNAGFRWNMPFRNYLF